MTEEELSTRSTFPERLKSAIGGAYFPAMRRAVQVSPFYHIILLT